MSDQEVRLTVEQAKQYGAIEAAIDGRLTNGQVADALGLSVRQVQRLKRQVEALGPRACCTATAGAHLPTRLPMHCARK